MQISVIGTGGMAQPLAQGWLNAGHKVCFGSRDPGSKTALAASMPQAQIKSVDEAIAFGEVIVIALRYVNVEDFAKTYAEQLRPKLIIDISNPFDNLPDNRVGAQEITARAIGDGARVVAAFKTNFIATLLEPIDPKTNTVRDVLLAGDSDEDKQIVAGLVEDLGFQAVDCGVLRNGRIIDGMVPLLIELHQRYAESGHWTSLKLLR